LKNKGRLRYLAFLCVGAAVCLSAFEAHAEESYSLVNLKVPQTKWLAYVVPPKAIPQKLLAAAAKSPYGKYNYCPFLVRAIVQHGEREAAFAMLDLDGDETKLIKVGQKFEHGGERFYVKSITANAVRLRSGASTLKCRLFK